MVFRKAMAQAAYDLPKLTTFVQIGGWTTRRFRFPTRRCACRSWPFPINQRGGLRHIDWDVYDLFDTRTQRKPPSTDEDAAAGTLLDEGSLNVQNNGTLNIQGNLSINSPGILTSAIGSTMRVSGNLLATTQNADEFNPQGTVQFDGAGGTSNPPQLLEAMSVDMGAVSGWLRQQFRLRLDQFDR